MNNFQWTNQKVVYTFGASKELELSSQGSVWLLLSLLLATAFVHALLSSAFPELPSKTAVQLKRQDVVYRRVILGEPEEEDELPDEFKDKSHFGKHVKDIRRATNMRMSVNPMPGAGDGAAEEDIMKITLNPDV